MTSIQPLAILPPSGVRTERPGRHFAWSEVGGPWHHETVAERDVRQGLGRPRDSYSGGRGVASSLPAAGFAAQLIGQDLGRGAHIPDHRGASASYQRRDPAQAPPAPGASLSITA